MIRRRALVTGSLGGIGSATVKRLVDAGYEVIGVDRHPAGDRADHVQFDLARPDAGEALLALVGPVDILVNNAGVALQRPFTESTVDDFRLTFDVNVRAPFLLCQSFAPLMAERGWGRIVNVSSNAARTGGTVSNSALYAASKAALLTLTKSVAREFGPAGVTANTIAPGAIATDMAHSGRSEQAKAALLAQIPVARFGTPADVAALIGFLVGEESGYINGATVDINGGWFMH